MDELEKNIRKTLGRRIREERTQRGWTIEHLAERMDLSPSFLGSVERGERSFSLAKLYAVSELFGVTTDSLIKENLPDPSRVESFGLLLNELDDSEYRSVYEIARTATRHLKRKA